MGENSKKDVPYIVHESITTKLERTIEKLWILCIILIVLLVGSNLAWIYYESQFEITEETTVQQDIEANSDDGSDLNINAIGGDYYGIESENKANSNEK